MLSCSSAAADVDRRQIALGGTGGCHWVWFQASVCKAGRPTKVPFGYEIVLWVLFVLFVLSVLTRSFVGFVSVRAVALGAGVVSEWLS